MVISPAPIRRGLLCVAPAGIIVGMTAVMLMPAAATASPNSEPSILDPSATGTPAPTDTAPTPVPDPVLGVTVAAADLSLTDRYWQGSGGPGDVRLTVTNAGDSTEWVVVSYALPGGVHATAACACTASVPAGQTWTTALSVSVDPDAWRHAPLVGSATATATFTSRPDIPAVHDVDGFSVLLPPGPPTPGVALSAADVVLPALRRAGTETAALGVRLLNSGAATADAAVEVLTPDGVGIVTFPTDCLSHRRLAAHRDRCELGQLETGHERVLTFGLSIGPLVRGEAPLSGAVHAFLTPPGQDTAEVQTMYRVVVTSAPAPPAGAAPSAGVPVPASRAAAAGGAGGPAGNGSERVVRDNFLGDPIAVLPVVGAVVGLASIVALFVVLSLRGRLQDEVEPLPPADKTAG